MAKGSVYATTRSESVLIPNRLRRRSSALSMLIKWPGRNPYDSAAHTKAVIITMLSNRTNAFQA